MRGDDVRNLMSGDDVRNLMSGQGPTGPRSAMLARMVVDALAQAGVRQVLLCPGSRSAPLAYVLARSPSGPALHVRHDERVAAFTALGAGLAGDGFGAVVTTSGTAVANLHPAVLEAHHANRPLVVITADRPLRLRGTWANQTSELQAGIFGNAVRARLDLDDAAAAADPTAAAESLQVTLAVALGHDGDGGRPGPVHLNLGFDEPLIPDGGPLVRDGGAPVREGGALVREGGSPDSDGEGVRSGTAAPASPCSRLAAPPVSGGSVAAPAAGPRLVLPASGRAVVLAGDGAGPAARACAEAAGLPLLAEPSSGARGGPNAVGPYRLLLELPEFGGTVERVIAFGRPTLSRPVTRLIGRPDVDVVLVSPHVGWPDPGRPVRRCAVVDVPARPVGAWLTSWLEAGAAAECAIDEVLDGAAAAGRLTGPLLAREVWDALGSGEALVAGASNPVRDLDLAARPVRRGALPRVFANRGLAGIDGTMSTATGLALSGLPTRVLLGDVTFLHDVGALLRARGESPADLQVVVLDDDGGGIFGLLEYGALAETGGEPAVEFERLFGTPHGVDLGELCRAFGVPHERVDDLEHLRVALARPRHGLHVLRVPADRAGLRDLHAQLRAAVQAAVST